jgi:hypothetical protein
LDQKYPGIEEKTPMKFIRTTLAVLALTLSTSSVSHAGILKEILQLLLQDLQSQNSTQQNNPAPAPQAPEVDPAMGMGALSLISGGIMVIRGRRKKKD